MNDELPSRRLIPPNWLDPIPLDDFFAHPGRPFEVDVGSGKGRFLLARAAANPEVNFLGIDRLLGRIQKVDRKACRAGLAHLRLLRMDAFYATTYLMPPLSVHAYYVFFPDPWPKTRHHRHRLFNTPYMEALYRTLRPGGLLHFATDHLPYFAEVAAIISEDPRFESIPAFVPGDAERTDFELMFRATKPIARCSFRKRTAIRAPTAGPEIAPA